MSDEVKLNLFIIFFLFLGIIEIFFESFSLSFFSFLTTEWGLKTIDWFQMSFFVYHHLLIQSKKIYFHFSILCICVCVTCHHLETKSWNQICFFDNCFYFFLSMKRWNKVHFKIGMEISVIFLYMVKVNKTHWKS